MSIHSRRLAENVTNDLPSLRNHCITILNTVRFCNTHNFRICHRDPLQVPILPYQSISKGRRSH